MGPRISAKVPVQIAVTAIIVPKAASVLVLGTIKRVQVRPFAMQMAYKRGNSWLAGVGEVVLVPLYVHLYVHLYNSFSFCEQQ